MEKDVSPVMLDQSIEKLSGSLVFVCEWWTAVKP
jgi:hypothetical protein